MKLRTVPGKCLDCDVTDPARFRKTGRGRCIDCIRKIRQSDPLWREKQAEAGARPANRYSRLRIQAKQEGKALAMTVQEYAEMVVKPCYYCGVTLKERGRGLDRMANDGPYSVDNCVPCCGICNVSRSDIFTLEEMKEIIGPAIRAVRTQREARGEKLAYPSFLDRKARTTRREDLRNGRYGGTHRPGGKESWR